MKRGKGLNESRIKEPKRPIDLWKLVVEGGKSRRVKGSPPPDSLLAVYKDRLTYTFLLGKEVASIHFDRNKGEIYFKGHNIANYPLSIPQLHALNGLKEVLKADSRGKLFLTDYEATLGERLADKI